MELEKHRNVQEVSERPAVTENPRDYRYVRKLSLSKCSEKSKSSRNALSVILCPDYVQALLFYLNMVPVALPILREISGSGLKSMKMVEPW